jgi:hypothetical protein
MTFISIHYVIIYIVFFGACMRCTRLCPLKPGVTPQEEDIDQGGDDDNDDKEDEHEIQDQRPPHPRVHQAIQRDHPINSILGDIHKGVTTRSRVAHFCEHYSFASSIEP